MNSVIDTDECLTNTDGCNQICINTIGSFQCSCIDGYTLSPNKKSCLDINECTAGTHNCQQHCININGGFLCGCNSGYQLNSDGRNCSGELNVNTSNNSCITMFDPIQILMSATLIKTIVIRFVPIPLDRFSAAVMMDTLSLPMEDLA